MKTDWQEAMVRPGVPGFFVTATDTGVGKTAVTAALCQLLRRDDERVLAFKPLASGAVQRDQRLISEDAEQLSASLGGALTPDEVCPVVYPDWLAPGIAAAEHGETIDWARIGTAWRHVIDQASLLLVEGAGGLEVPLDASGTPTVLDLMAHLGLSALVVARSGLGTLNHTALTLAALRHRGVKVAGVILNDGAENVTDDASVTTNRAWMERMTGERVLARLATSTHDPVWTDPAWQEILEKVDWRNLA